MTASRTLAIVLVLLMVAAPGAVAQALAPPPVDDRWLPAPAAPAPPEATVQREVCAAPTADAGPPQPGAPTQLGGLDLSTVWSLTRGAGVRVAVIDTGVTPHPRLADLVFGGDYVAGGDGGQDCDGHGTMVAGIIAGAPDPTDRGFTGVAPAATVISIRQSSTRFSPAADPSSSGFGDVNTLAMAVRTAADLGAAVINISSVACVTAGAALNDRALGAALAYAVDTKDAVVVAAAGNTEGVGACPAQAAESTWASATVAVSPAWYDDYVLAVGSVGPTGAASTFTLAGPWLDVAAPGEAVVSLSPAGVGVIHALPGADGPTPIQGTSYAAPVVSGLAALIRSRFPDWTARQVMQRINDTAHHPPSGWNPLVGNGLIDPLAAVSTDPGTPTPAPTPAPATATTTTPRATTAPTVADASPTTTPTATLTARPDQSARRTAFTGATACLGTLLVAAVAVRLGRTRPDRDGVAGDRRVGSG